MSDWQKGDLALCVNDSPARHPLISMPSGLRAGAVYTVSNIYSHPVGKSLDFEEATQPENQHWYQGFAASRFRKIPPHAPDAEDAETIRLLNGAPVGEPA